MRLVIVESPFASADPAVRAQNIWYARACVRDCVLRGDAPIASHLLFTQLGILDDDVPAERQLGIDAGLAWRKVADASVVYTDRGISKGMEYGIAFAIGAGVPVEYRAIGQVAVDDREIAHRLMCDLDAILHRMCEQGSTEDRQHASWAHGLIHDAAPHVSPDPLIRAIGARKAQQEASDAQPAS